MPSGSASKRGRPPKEPKETKSGEFVLQSKNIFLTWPKTEADKKQACEKMLNHLLMLTDRKKTKSIYKKEDIKIMCVQEKHQDGTPHLHMVVSLPERLRVRDKNYFDFVTGKHGNYAPVKISLNHSLAYCAKSDTFPELIGWTLQEIKDIVAKVSRSKMSTADKVAIDLSSGASLPQIAADYPGYYLQHSEKIKKLATFYRTLAERQLKRKYPGALVYSGDHVPTKLFIAWVNSNLFKERPYKTPQLFVYGGTDMRKTSLYRLLKLYCVVYKPTPEMKDFPFNLYDDDLYDLVFIDAFKGNFEIQLLEKFLDGTFVVLNSKNGFYYKTVNKPVLICANWSLEECYRGAIFRHETSIEPLKVRLDCVEVREQPREPSLRNAYYGPFETGCISEPDGTLLWPLVVPHERQLAALGKGLAKPKQAEPDGTVGPPLCVTTSTDQVDLVLRSPPAAEQSTPLVEVTLPPRSSDPPLVVLEPAPALAACSSAPPPPVIAPVAPTDPCDHDYIMGVYPGFYECLECGDITTDASKAKGKNRGFIV